MVTVQIINKILSTKDFGIVLNNALTSDMFIGYESEFNFIVEHYNKYKTIPDPESFVSEFQEFPLTNVTEPDKYLLETLYEEVLYYRSVDVIQKVAEYLKTDSNVAVEYLHSQLNNLKGMSVPTGTDIIKHSKERYQLYQDKMNGDVPWYVTTGFEELDALLNGWSKGEELVVIFARLGQGKSWILTKTLQHAWQIGNRVGYISPEMSASKIGYRVDTLNDHFSNTNLVWGRKEDGYEVYVDKLKENKTPFIVATQNDFDKRITVSKLRNFIQGNKLDILGIDGINYLADERHKKGDNKTTSLTNISEDLMELSIDMGIPILVVTQSNRGGARDEDLDGTPEIENISDSDGIARNATKVLAIRQTGAGLEFGVKKHRDGVTGGKLLYYWDIDKGVFNYIPSEGDSVPKAKREAKVKEMKNNFKDGVDKF